MSDTETMEETEMYEQTQAFPKTPLEIADEFLEHFQGDVESAEKSLINARIRLTAARILRDDAEENLRRERIAAGVATVEELASDMKRSAEEAGIGLSFAINGEEPIVVTEAPAVDQITGEAASIREAEPEPLSPEASALADAMGLSRPQADWADWVEVLYPGSDKPVVTEIGEKTRYGELVADYFTAAGLNGKQGCKVTKIGDWSVLAEDEITTTGGVRKLRDVIAGADYGKRLLVVAADQGSVTGADAAQQSAA
jgi:hypothetical protein